MSDTEKLYYYAKVATGIEHILSKMEIICNPLIKLSDPFENKHIQLTGVGNNPLKASDKHSEFREKLQTKIVNSYKITCFCIDRKIGEKTINGWSLPRMWDQYADRQKGLCLRIDKKKFLEENKSKILYKGIVKYDIEIPKVTIDIPLKKGAKPDISKFIKTKRKDLFFYKNYNYEGEQEYRVIRESSNKDQEYFSIKNSLEAIILGFDFNLNYLPAIKKLSKPSNSIQKLNISKDGYFTSCYINDQGYYSEMEDGLLSGDL